MQLEEEEEEEEGGEREREREREEILHQCKLQKLASHDYWLLIKTCKHK